MVKRKKKVKNIHLDDWIPTIYKEKNEKNHQKLNRSLEKI